jgi:cytochrome c oxidase assembly protein subunit 15
MSRSINNAWLHRFAVLTAMATLVLLGIGGLVTSHEAGMAVPDWPTSYGYNMFALPFKFWTGGVFYEHTHRLWATLVGTLIVALTRWLGGSPSRRALVIVGFAEIAAGTAILFFWPGLKSTGHFLTGIGGVVLLAALVWVRNQPAKPYLVRLGWLAFALVQFQGLLGGLRVVMYKDEIGIFHGTLAQLFFVLTCAIALLTSRWWANFEQSARISREKESSDSVATPAAGVQMLFIATTALVLLQLILGATMRHQHAGLAISDFPLAHGRLWPATDPDSIARYNQQRVETTNVNAITAFQVQLQMAHRLIAALIVVAVAACAWRVQKWKSRSTAPVAEEHQRRFVVRASRIWLGLIVAQAGLGAATVLSNKAADVATAHVLAGALSLATGAMLCIVSGRAFGRVSVSIQTTARPATGNSLATGSAAAH